MTRRRITREQLALIPTPAGTDTHKVIPHIEVVNAIIETLGFRHIAVHKDEYAVSRDGNKMFGLMELDQTFTGCRFALGIRNSHDKTMRLAMTVGYRVFVCDNMAFQGDFTPLLAKHTKNFQLTRALSAGMDDMQRNFEPMVKAVERWRGDQLTDVTARLLIYRAFIESELDVPRHLDRRCMTSTSTRSTKTSSRARCGACRTPSLRRSRSWSRYHSSGRPRSLRDSSVPRSKEANVTEKSVEQRPTCAVIRHAACNSTVAI